ncbi:MAG: type I-C CRISPR-associated protein Cas8c/Csd1 [Chlamydiota bacterium]
MILQNLIQYCQKNKAELPSFGFEYKEISFVILLDKKGKFLNIQDKRTPTGEGEKMLVPQSVKRSGTGLKPNYLWDNLKYVFGVGDSKNPKQQDALEQKKESFLQNLTELLPSLKDHEEIQAVVCFLKSNFLQAIQKKTLWKELIKLNAYVSFSIENTNRLVCQESSISQAFSLFSQNTEEKNTFCLLTGNKKPITRLHPFIQGVYGAQGSGASLVSYNLPSAESFGKEQGYNAPMSQAAVFDYSTALNHLLESSQKVAFSQAMTVVFWSQIKNSFEDSFADFLKSPLQESSSLLAKCLEEPEDSTLFYIHTLSPNGARLSLRLSWTGSIAELKKRFKKHLEDLDITNHLNTQKSFPVYSLMQAFSPCRDVKYVQPHLAGEFLSSILNNLPYPQMLLPNIIEKLSDEEGISQRRAALIKACINRSPLDLKMQAQLDTYNKSPGYLLGRLFAVLDLTRKQLRKQKEAPSAHSFYKMASTSPKKTFSFLLKRHLFHTPCLLLTHSNYFNTLKDSILGSILEFPLILSLTAQGEFAIGYYQQKQKIFIDTRKGQFSHDI